MRDVRAKLCTTLIIATGVLLLRSSWYPGFAVLFLGAWSISSCIAPLTLLRRAWSVRWFLVAIIALNALTLPGAVIAGGGGIYLTREGVVSGAWQGIRLLIAVWGASLFMLTSPIEEMMDAAEQWSARRGRPLIAVGAVTLAYLPLLVESARRVRAARRARGCIERTGILSGVRNAIDSALPLFAVALRNADALADAMDARGFSPRAPRTPFHTPRMPGSDAGVLLIVLAATATAIYAP